jgi:hypothetical protein
MQMFYLPGSNFFPTQMPGAAQYMAPVIQASPGSDPRELSGKFSDVAKIVASSFGKELAMSLFKAWVGR